MRLLSQRDPAKYNLSSSRVDDGVLLNSPGQRHMVRLSLSKAQKRWLLGALMCQHRHEIASRAIPVLHNLRQAQISRPV